MAKKQSTGERIISLLQERGETINEAAKKMGVSPSLLSEVRSAEEGKRKERNIGGRNLVKICEYFGVSSDYLLGMSEVKTPDASLQGIQQLTNLSEKAAKKLCSLSDEERFLIEALLTAPADLHLIAGAFGDYRGKHGLNAAIDGGVIPDDYGADTLCIRNDLEYAEFTLQNRFMKFARKEEV